MIWDTFRFDKTITPGLKKIAADSTQVYGQKYSQPGAKDFAQPAI
jgi:hypothetical protein